MECEKKNRQREVKSYSVLLNFDKICSSRCKVYEISSFELNYSKH